MQALVINSDRYRNATGWSTSHMFRVPNGSLKYIHNIYEYIYSYYLHSVYWITRVACGAQGWQNKLSEVICITTVVDAVSCRDEVAFSYNVLAPMRWWITIGLYIPFKSGKVYTKRKNTLVIAIHEKEIFCSDPMQMSHLICHQFIVINLIINLTGK